MRVHATRFESDSPARKQGRHTASEPTHMQTYTHAHNRLNPNTPHGYGRDNADGQIGSSSRSFTRSHLAHTHSSRSTLCNSDGWLVLWPSPNARGDQRDDDDTQCSGTCDSIRLLRWCRVAVPWTRGLCNRRRWLRARASLIRIRSGNYVIYAVQFSTRCMNYHTLGGGSVAHSTPGLPRAFVRASNRVADTPTIQSHTCCCSDALVNGVFFVWSTNYGKFVFFWSREYVKLSFGFSFQCLRMLANKCTR